jgi:hypothetical protein
MASVEPNATSFTIKGIKYGQEITIAIDGEIMQKFNCQLESGQLGVYLNKERRSFN